MKKTILKIASITAAFFLGLMGMGYYLMAGNADSTAHMASATLPLIYLKEAAAPSIFSTATRRAWTRRISGTLCCRFLTTGRFPSGLKVRIRLYGMCIMKCGAPIWSV